MREISGVIEMKCEKVSGGDSRNPESGQGRETPGEPAVPESQAEARPRERYMCFLIQVSI